MATSMDRPQDVHVMGKSVNKDLITDYKTEPVDDAANKKEHRRAQVRKAQIEHRQRKENHIKVLEKEVADLRKLIDDVEHQSHIFKLENESIRLALNIGQPQSQPLPEESTPKPDDSTDGGSYVVQPPAAVHALDAVATVNFDSAMNVNYLHLKRGNEIRLQPDGSAFYSQAGTDFGVSIPPGPTPQFHVAPSHAASSEGQRQQQVTAELYEAHRDTEVALRAINFILALEHPCRTHFIPKTDKPCPGIPAPPDHVPSGHDMMASTYLYRHAPMPVFEAMHAGSPFLPPSDPIDPIDTQPWSVPARSPTDELMKLYGMATSLSKEDWEITPVQAWFILVQRFGIQKLSEEWLFETLKIRLGALTRCFGFGTVVTEMEFWDVVKDVVGDAM